MAPSHFDQFLSQAIHQNQDAQAGLGADELYGLYASWCLIKKMEPQPPEVLWEALIANRILPGDSHLAMTGPAAVVTRTLPQPGS
ncbi:hypothetical protein [Arthrobacter sp. UYCu712]|uniref:hypothetical protein n=1 Tax=Arthrobacter sp. UYCu712 TaxID=3156340 RepID=UPI0033941247